MTQEERTKLIENIIELLDKLDLVIKSENTD
jgi:hypothetical protein